MPHFHWDPEKKCIVDGPAPVGRPPEKTIRSKGGGISFQFPPGYDDGSGKIRHVRSGLFKGRVYFESPREAREIAKRYEDKASERMRYDR